MNTLEVYPNVEAINGSLLSLLVESAVDWAHVS